tara:strand:+ start:3022 stop:3123 length:102 start_codon:yes stop_codon:yes gene_type:complete
MQLLVKSAIACLGKLAGVMNYPMDSLSMKNGIE